MLLIKQLLLAGVRRSLPVTRRLMRLVLARLPLRLGWAIRSRATLCKHRPSARPPTGHTHTPAGQPKPGKNTHHPSHEMCQTLCATFAASDTSRPPKVIIASTALRKEEPNASMYTPPTTWLYLTLA